MFHLGTRMPSIHEADYAEYPDFDMIKTGYPPEPARCVLLLLPHLPSSLFPRPRNAEPPNSCICPQEHGLLVRDMTRPTRSAPSAVCCSAVFFPSILSLKFCVLYHHYCIPTIRVRLTAFIRFHFQLRRGIHFCM
jgi:hypothetical protein